MTVIVPVKPTRKDFEKFLPDLRTVKAFESLFDKIPSDVNDLTEQVNFLLARIQKTASITSSFNVPIGNYSVLADATAGLIIVTLPLAADSKSFIIGTTKIDSSTNIVRIQRSGSDLIAGETSHDILFEEEVLNFISEGTNWELVN